MKKNKLVCSMLFVVAMLIALLVLSGGSSYAAELTPEENQYMELKVDSIEPVEGAGTQVILELWSYNLDFKGADVRFSYDSTKLNPSNITTNVATTGTDCFAFENGFGGFMEMFQVPEAQSNVLRYVISLNPIMDEEGNVTYTSTNSNLIRDEVNGDYISSTDGVLIGKLSFILTEGAEIDDNTFALVTSEDSSPLTGVKIAKSSEDYYSNQSVFKFTVITTGTVSGNITKINENATATIKAYPQGTVDWSNKAYRETVDVQVPVLTVPTNNDGTYSLELTQGVYDILIDKDGYLDGIYTNVTVVKNTDLVLGEFQTFAGDNNKDGKIDAKDIDLFNQNYGIIDTSEKYVPTYNYTEDNKIDATDKDIINKNFGKIKNIINKGEE